MTYIESDPNTTVVIARPDFEWNVPQYEVYTFDSYEEAEKYVDSLPDFDGSRTTVTITISRHLRRPRTWNSFDDVPGEVSWVRDSQGNRLHRPRRGWRDYFFPKLRAPYTEIPDTDRK